MHHDYKYYCVPSRAQLTCTHDELGRSLHNSNILSVRGDGYYADVLVMIIRLGEGAITLHLYERFNLSEGLHKL